jgi:sugar lactone lactonase YvrE
MSTLTQFTVTGKEKDDFYGFHITGQTNQVINRTITKNITGTYTNQHLYEFALGTAYDASTITFTNATSLVRLAGAEIETGGYYNLYNRSGYTAAQKGLSTIEGFCFNNDGTKAYAVDSHHARIMQYALSSAYNVTTLSFEKELKIGLKGLTPVAIRFNNDGTKMFIVENGGNAEQGITGG